MTTWKLDTAHTQINFSRQAHDGDDRPRHVPRRRRARSSSTRPTRPARAASSASPPRSVDTNFGARDAHLRSRRLLRRRDATRRSPSSRPAIRQAGDDAFERHRRPDDPRRHPAGRPSTSSSRASSRGMSGARHAGLSATTKLEREAWGLDWNVALEQGGWLVGKEIKLEIAVAADEVAVAEPGAGVASAVLTARRRYIRPHGPVIIAGCSRTSWSSAAASSGVAAAAHLARRGGRPCSWSGRRSVRAHPGATPASSSIRSTRSSSTCIGETLEAYRALRRRADGLRAPRRAGRDAHGHARPGRRAPADRRAVGGLAVDGPGVPRVPRRCARSSRRWLRTSRRAACGSATRSSRSPRPGPMPRRRAPAGAAIERAPRRGRGSRRPRPWRRAARRGRARRRASSRPAPSSSRPARGRRRSSTRPAHGGRSSSLWGVVVDAGAGGRRRGMSSRRPGSASNRPSRMRRRPSGRTTPSAW